MALAAFLLGWTAQAQIIVPDRLPQRAACPCLTTSAERGTLPYDTVRTLPTEDGGRDTWWHRHALFTDGRVRMAMDPVVEYAPPMAQAQRGRQRRTHRVPGSATSAVSVTPARIDSTVRFGGKVLEMQRVLVGPDTEYVLAAGRYPGMGPGKLRPAGNGLSQIDHSLAEVWFDVKAGEAHAGCNGDWVRSAWDREHATCFGMPDMAPAPYLFLEVDLGSRMDLPVDQSRQRSIGTAPCRRCPRRDGMHRSDWASAVWARRGLNEHTLHVNWVSPPRWTDAQQRGQAGLQHPIGPSPWHRGVPLHRDTANAWFSTGHHGVDLQWRRPRSTWYGQARFGTADRP